MKPEIVALSVVVIVTITLAFFVLQQQKARNKALTDEEQNVPAHAEKVQNTDIPTQTRNRGTPNDTTQEHKLPSKRSQACVTKKTGFARKLDKSKQSTFGPLTSADREPRISPEFHDPEQTTGVSDKHADRTQPEVSPKLIGCSETGQTMKISTECNGHDQVTGFVDKHEPSEAGQTIEISQECNEHEPSKHKVSKAGKTTEIPKEFSEHDGVIQISGNQNVCATRKIAEHPNLDSRLMLLEQQMFQNLRRLEKSVTLPKECYWTYASLPPDQRQEIYGYAHEDVRMFMQHIDRLLNLDIHIRVEFFRRNADSIFKSMFEREARYYNKHVEVVGRGAHEKSPFVILGYWQEQPCETWVVKFAWKTKHSYHIPQVAPCSIQYEPSPPRVILQQEGANDIVLPLQSDCL